MNEDHTSASQSIAVQNTHLRSDRLHGLRRDHRRSRRRRHRDHRRSRRRRHLKRDISELVKCSHATKTLVRHGEFTSIDSQRTSVAIATTSAAVAAAAAATVTAAAAILIAVSAGDFLGAVLALAIVKHELEFNLGIHLERVAVGDGRGVAENVIVAIVRLDESWEKNEMK